MPSNLKFGLSFAGIFAVIATYTAWKGSPHLPWVMALLAVIFGLLALIAPNLLSWPNRLWFKLGEVLGKVVSPIVLGLLFFVLITPVALVMRLSGRDALRLRRLRRQDKASYWITRDPLGPSPNSYKQQY